MTCVSTQTTEYDYTYKHSLFFFKQLLECDPHFVLCYHTLSSSHMCFLSVVLAVCEYQRLRSRLTLRMTLAL